MSDNIDKQLRDRINQVFDSFEDRSAEEGWEKLRQQFPKKNGRRPFVLWFSSAAAALLIFTGIWFFKLSNANIEQTVKKSLLVKPSPDQNSDLISSDSSAQLMSLPEDKNLSKQILVKAQGRSIPSKSASVADVPSPESVEIQQRSESDLMPVDKYESEAGLTLFALAPKTTLKPDTGSQNSHLKSVELEDKSGINLEEKRLASENSALKTTTDKEAPRVSEKKALKKDLPRTAKNISFGFVGGSYLNYAQGSEPNINTGIGIISELPLTAKLKFSTGISFGQNSLRYNEVIPQALASGFVSSSPVKSNNLYYRGSASPISSMSHIINGYNARLFGLDIPLNLKYTLSEKSNMVYIIAGFSSNLFIKESYTYDFNYLMNDVSINAANQEVTSISHGFDFARMLNISLGIEYPISEFNHISVEPFLKYPIGGMGAHNLHFGAAGLNLKVNFNKQKGN